MKRREFHRMMLRSAAAVVPVAWRRTPPAVAYGRAVEGRTIHADRLRDSLERLAEFGKNPEGGVSRVAWTQPDIDGRRFVMTRLMSGMGLSVRIDAAGSIFGRREGTENLPVILFGSHIDSVPHGGNYDGTVGSLAAIEVMRTLHERKVATRHPLECVIWTNEEGTNFGRGLFGSRAAVGHFEAGELDDRNEAGVHIRDAVRGIGGDLDRIQEARRKPGDIAGYLELHVEQGGVLDKKGIQIGVVQGIVGITRHTVKLHGFANHAGTTPMPDRHDALLPASRLVQIVREETVREPGAQVGTVGKLDVFPNVPNIVPGEVNLIVELRDLSLEKIRRIFSRIETRARETAAEDGIEIEIGLKSIHEPALATESIQGVIEREAVSAGLTALRMPSGAGHDAQMMAQIAPMGMIFVPSVQGISHSPKELTEWVDVANGCEVLYRTVLALDRGATA